MESGHHADLWLELDQLVARPAALRPFATELARRVAIHGVDCVCGPLSGGAFLAELMALELGVEFAFAERSVSQRSGLFPVVIGALLALGQGGLEFGAARHLPFERLAEFPARTWPPTECPLCVSGVPVAEP